MFRSSKIPNYLNNILNELRIRLHPQLQEFSEFLTKFPNLRAFLFKIYSYVFFSKYLDVSPSYFAPAAIPHGAAHSVDFISENLILIDCQSFQSSSFNRGIGRYSRKLIAAMAAEFPNVNFLLVFNLAVSQEIVDKVFNEIVVNFKNTRIYIAPVFPTINKKPFDSTSRELTQDLAIFDPRLILILSVFESSMHVIPINLNQFRTSATILYDVIPLQFPEIFLKTKNAKYVYEKQLDYLLTSSVVFSISKKSIENLIQIGAKLSTYRVIHGAGFHVGDFGVGEPLNVRKGIVAVGSDSPHKNLRRLIRAYLLLRKEIRKSHPLNILGVSKGQRSTLTRNLEFSQDEIIFHDYVSEDKLTKFYANTRISIVPSLEEGFGMPILESWEQGTVVLGSKGNAIEEVLGVAGIVFEPYSEDSMSEVINKYLVDDEVWLEEQNRILDRRNLFTWAKTVRSIADLISDDE